MVHVPAKPVPVFRMAPFRRSFRRHDRAEILNAPAVSVRRPDQDTTVDPVVARRRIDRDVDARLRSVVLSEREREHDRGVSIVVAGDAIHDDEIVVL
jgi:hypothetical protein